MITLPKINIKKRLLTTAVLVIVFSVIGLATAQEIQRTYTVVNPQITVKLDPGTKTEGTTKVINDSNVPITFNLSVQDYIVVDNRGTPNLLPPNTLNSKYSGASWILVTPSTFTLKPQEKQVINYYISVPQEGRPGGHYAAIVYSPVTKAEGKASGGVVSTQIGSLFYITVNGKITEKAQVTKFFTNPFQEYGPVKILTQIKNMGDLHIKPSGKITLSGLFNNKTYTLPEGNIFPEISRDYDNTLGQLLMIGKYKAQLLATYGVNNNLPLTATVEFWVFPWRLVILITLIIVAIILGYKYYQKRKRDASKSTQEPKNQTETPVTTEQPTVETSKQ